MSPNRHYCSQGPRLQRIETSQAEHRAEHRTDQDKTRAMLEHLTSHIDDAVQRLIEASTDKEAVRRQLESQARQLRKLFARIDAIAAELGVD